MRSTASGSRQCKLRSKLAPEHVNQDVPGTHLPATAWPRQMLAVMCATQHHLSLRVGRGDYDPPPRGQDGGLRVRTAPSSNAGAVPEGKWRYEAVQIETGEAVQIEVERRCKLRSGTVLCSKLEPVPGSRPCTSPSTVSPWESVAVTAASPPRARRSWKSPSTISPWELVAVTMTSPPRAKPLLGNSGVVVGWLLALMQGPPQTEGKSVV